MSNLNCDIKCNNGVNSLQILCEAANSQIAQISLAADELNLKNKNIYSSNGNSTLLFQYTSLSDEYIVGTKHKLKSCNAYNSNRCQYCDRVCLKPSVLEKHLRTHTNERPYPCVECNQSFKTLSNLHKHEKTLSHLHIHSQSSTVNTSTDFSSHFIKSTDCEELSNRRELDFQLIDRTGILDNDNLKESNLKSKLQKNILTKSHLNISNISSLYGNTAINNSNPVQPISSIAPKHDDPTIVQLDQKTISIIEDRINDLISKNQAVIESNLNNAPPIRTKSAKLDNYKFHNYKKIAPKFVRDNEYYLNKNNKCDKDTILADFSTNLSVLERQLSLPISSTNHLSNKIIKSNTISDPTYLDSCTDIQHKRRTFANSSKFNISPDSSYSSTSINLNDTTFDENSKYDFNTKVLETTVNSTADTHFTIPTIETRKRGRPKGSKTRKHSSQIVFSKPYLQCAPSGDSHSEKLCKNILKEHIMKRSLSSENSGNQFNKASNNYNQLDLEEKNEFILRSKSFDSSMPFKKRLLVNEGLVSNEVDRSSSSNLSNKFFFAKSNIEPTINNEPLNFDNAMKLENKESKNSCLSTNNSDVLNKGNNLNQRGTNYLQYLQFCVNKSKQEISNKNLFQTSRCILQKYKQLKLKAIRYKSRNFNNIVNNNYISGYPSNLFVKDSLRCNLCNKLCISAMFLTMHRNAHYLDKKYRCQLGCNSSFQVPNSLRRHQRKCSGASLKERMTKENQLDPRPFKCDTCACAFRTNGYLVKHINSKYHARSLICTDSNLYENSCKNAIYNSNKICINTNNTAENTKSLNIYVSNADDRIECTLLDNTSTNIDEVSDTLINQSNENLSSERVMASHQRKQLLRSSNIEIDEYNSNSIDFNEKNIGDIISSKFDAKNDINSSQIKLGHIKISDHSNLDNQGARDKLNVANQRMVNKDKEYINDSQLENTCKICGYSSDELKNLMIHIYSHICLYVCKICDAAFSTKVLLESHFLLHR